MKTKNTSSPEYTPSPEEIRHRCQEIQQRWTKKERKKRTVGAAGHALVRQYDLRDLMPKGELSKSWSGV